MPKWTAAQQSAIDANNSELLISAAAGSGKTAVLIERILRLVHDGYAINRMVIVTFTKAAAAQLRDRLQRKLSEAAEQGDTVAHAQLALLPVTQIGTIHSFCGTIIKEYFHVAGIDPNFKQVDDQRRERYFTQAMNEALDACFEGGDADFMALGERFGDADIQDMLKGLYSFIMSLARPFDWLDRMTGEAYTAHSLETHPMLMVLINECRMCLSGIDQMAADLMERLDSPYANAKWKPVITNDIAIWQSALQACDKGYQAIRSAFNTSFMKAAILRNLEGEQSDWHESMKVARKQFCEAIKKAAALLPESLDLAAADMNAMQPALRGLKALTLTFHERFTAIKEKQNVLDFNDLEHMALKVLDDTSARTLLQNQYDHIFVDEYQDVGDAEEGIFRALHHEGNFLFMVGDVKQSIYRFRLCDPTLFLSKQESFSLEESATQRKIFLNQNFRSEPEVLRSVNRVFEHVMRKSVTELDYDDAAHLYAGRVDQAPRKTQLHIVPYDSKALTDEGEVPDKRSGEFERVAELILKQMDRDIFDNERNGMRRTRFRDIAILLPKAKGIALPLSRVLQQYGIPAYADNDEEYFALPEVQRMMYLLSVIDNPRRDVAFLSTLKLPVFHYTDEELADIRLKKKDGSFYEAFMAYALIEQRASKTLAMLDSWRFRAAHTPLDALVWELMKESGLYLTAGAQKGGHVRQANLRMLCEHAANYQAVGRDGLYGFLQLGGGTVQGDSKTAKTISPNDDLVRVMTIHKSKGLEFPIVYILGLGDNLLLRQNAKLKMHSRLGIAIPYVEPQLRVKRKTLMQVAMQALNDLEDKAERARLLYVAMTRAEEQMVLLGTVGKIPKPEWLFTGEYGVYAAKTYLDWLCQLPGCCSDIVLKAEPGQNCGNVPTDFSTTSTGYPQAESPYEIYVCDELEEQTVENSDSISTTMHALSQALLWTNPNPVDKRLNKSAAQKHAKMPLKTSVSALVNNAPFSADEESMESKAADEQVVPPLSMKDIAALPAFMQPKQFTAADRGTAVHTALMHLQGADAIPRQLDAMAQDGILTQQQRDAIPIKWLDAFVHSDLYRRMQASDMVKKEWAFNLMLSQKSDTLVQGVIDMCFMENGGWVLCDYKTDRDPDAIRQRYEKQVSIYVQALERITKKPVHEAWLFALRTGEALRIK